ncbi:MAG: ABC transporter substrate-binding protein [bacterium]|nr:ABC transporter substrate-binding protein [bacterium]
MLQHRNRLCSRLVLIGSVSLISTLVACHRPAAERAEIRIGILVDSSDRVSSVQAANLALAAVKDAGGLDVGGEKRQVVLIVEDTKRMPGEAMDAARRTIQQNVVAVVGPNRSREAIPVANVAENARVPMISPESTHPQMTAGNDYAFRVSFTDPFQGRVMAGFAVEELHISTAAVLYDVANIYNRDIAAAFKEAMEAAGGQVVAFESYTTGDQDFRPQLQRVRDGKPEALFLPNSDADVAVQAKQARRLGIDAVILGSDAWSPGDITHHPELEGSFVSGPWNPDLADENAQIRTFIAAYRRAYDRDPTNTAALTYDAFGLLFQAIRSAGQADPERIRQALAQIENYRGVTGTITYRGTGGDPQKHVVIIQIKQGKIVPFQKVKPLPGV